MFIWRLKVRSRSAVQMRGVVDPERTLHVHPDLIQDACYWPRRRYDTVADRGRVLGGDWDRRRRSFSELDVCRAMVDRFANGREWEETDYYKWLLRQVGNGGKRGMTSRADVDQRCVDLDRLYASVRDHGYHAASERFRSAHFPQVEDEVVVRISREGDFLFVDGRHRLAIAKTLGLGKIPVKVSVRHRAWVEFVAEIRQYARERWTPKFGQLAKVGSRPRRRSLACHGRDGVIRLS